MRGSLLLQQDYLLPEDWNDCFFLTLTPPLPQESLPLPSVLHTVGSAACQARRTQVRSARLELP